MLTSYGSVFYLTFMLISNSVKYVSSDDGLNSTFAALADPTRRAILARLAMGESSVMQLAEPFEMSLPAVSRHLKVLEHAGLITRSRDAQWRPCRLKAEPLKVAVDWLEEYRRFWEESFDRLDDYLKVLQETRSKEAKGRRHGKDKRGKTTIGNAKRG